MGRPADEDLPEVYHPPPMASWTPLPEVVPDSSPEVAQQRHYPETDKYPAYYDHAPKLPIEEPRPGPQTPGQQYQHDWGGNQPVSALSPNSSVPWQSFLPGADDQQTYVGSEPEQEKRICGIRKRLFIIVAVIVGLVVVGAAIGGGVGGSMAARQAPSDGAEPAETTSVSSSTTSTTPTRTTTTTSSTTSALPTPLNLIDPADLKRIYMFQAFEKNNFTGKATTIYKDEGFYDLKFNATSWVWLPGDTDACVTFCTSKTKSGGYACQWRKRNATDNPKGFVRFNIWRGAWSKQTVAKYESKCS